MVSAVYIDQGPSVDGTALAANALNSAVVAQGYLISGGLVEVGAGGSISIGGVGMDIMQPQTEAVVARGDLTGYLLVPPTIIALSADMDNYVDLILESGGAFYTGAYSVSSVAIDAGAPAQDGGTLRLYRATVVSLGLGTAQVSAVQQLATPLPVGQALVTMDRAEVQTNDALSYTGSLRSNLNRIRYQMGVMIGGAWSAAVQMIPLSLRGAANGVAELDSSARVPNGELPTDVSLVGDLAVGGNVGQGIQSGYALSVGGSEYLAGDLGVLGSQSIVGYLSLGSYLAINHSNTSGFYLDVGGNSVLHGAAYIEGSVYADAGLYGNTGTNVLDLYGSSGIGIHGPVSTDSTLRVDSHVNMTHGNLNLEDAGSSASFNGTATIVGHTQINNTATITGLLTVNTIDGSSNLVTFNHNVNVGGTTLKMTNGAAQLSIGGDPIDGGHALTVNGAAYISGELDVPILNNPGSAVEVFSDLTVDGALTAGTTASVTGTLTAGGDVYVGSGDLHAEKIVCDQGPTHNAGDYQTYYGSDSTLVDAGLTGGCRDTYGAVKWNPGSAPQSGPQFSLNFRALRGAAPGVFLTVLEHSDSHTYTAPGGRWHVYQTDTGFFTVAFDFTPTAHADYCIYYFVID